MMHEKKQNHRSKYKTKSLPVPAIANTMEAPSKRGDGKSIGGWVSSGSV
jgi:hypothetical protein